MKSEFQFIRHIKKQFSLKYAGDDCAVLPKDESSDLLITADLLVENVDFRLEWSKPADLGHKSLAVSLSDIAAMGGTPTFAMLSLGVPRNLWNDDFLERFYSGWTNLAQRYGVELVGGDISSSEKLAIDSIVLGETAKNKAIFRSGATPGDAIFVSGTLGAAAAGLKLLEKKELETKWGDKAASLIIRQLRPTPQVKLGKQLTELGLVKSMIDISDGLSSDLAHLCEASGVGAVIDADSLPIDPEIPYFLPKSEDQLQLALDGGEDFGLLFTAPDDFVKRFGNVPVRMIGNVTDSNRIQIRSNEQIQDLQPKGFQHF